MLTWLGSRERQVVAVLCLLGGLRVLVFSAAFPPFHSTDEPFHFDLIVKYAAGHVPARVLDERLSADTVTTIVLYGTGWSRPRPAVLLDAVSQRSAGRGARGHRRALCADRLPGQPRPRARGPAPRRRLS